jgi:alcohol dehydrogenase, propanol-preferring
MKAQVLDGPAPIETAPLQLVERDVPEPGRGEVRLRVHVCACCRTDLHVVTGDLDLPKLPVVPGHQVVGVVDTLGEGCTRLRAGDRVGVCWLDDLAAAPLLCAGAVGFRALRRAEIEPGDRVALLGFGSSAHLAIQALHHWGCEVVVLTRGERHRALARELGAAWVGAADEHPPESCDRAVVFAPVGALVPVALRAVRPGGTVSLAGIHMTPLPVMDYSLLWRERSLRSVANLTRRDAEDFMALAAEANVRAEYDTYPLPAANDALAAIAADSVRGSAVLEVT